MALSDFTVIYNKKPILVRARNKRDAIKRIVKKECDGRDGSNVLKSESYLEQNVLPELKELASASETIYNFTDLKACMFFLRYDADPQIVECDDEDFIETIVEYTEFVLEKYGTQGKKGRLTARERVDKFYGEGPTQQIHSPAYSRSAMGKNPEKRVAFLEFWDRYYNEFFDVGGATPKSSTDVKRKAQKKVAKKEVRKTNVGPRLRTPSPSPPPREPSPEPVREPSPEPVRLPSPVPVEPPSAPVPFSNDTEILLETLKYFNVDGRTILQNANKIPNYFRTNQFVEDCFGEFGAVRAPRTGYSQKHKQRVLFMDDQRFGNEDGEPRVAFGSGIRDISTPEPPRVATPQPRELRRGFGIRRLPKPAPTLKSEEKKKKIKLKSAKAKSASASKPPKKETREELAKKYSKNYGIINSSLSNRSNYNKANYTGLLPQYFSDGELGNILSAKNNFEDELRKDDLDIKELKEAGEYLDSLDVKIEERMDEIDIRELNEKFADIMRKAGN